MWVKYALESELNWRRGEKINFRRICMAKKKNKEYNVPMNSSKENMKNRNCDYKTLAIMSLYSKNNHNIYNSTKFL